MGESSQRWAPLLSSASYAKFRCHVPVTVAFYWAVLTSEFLKNVLAAPKSQTLWNRNLTSDLSLSGRCPAESCPACFWWVWQWGPSWLAEKCCSRRAWRRLSCTCFHTGAVLILILSVVCDDDSYPILASIQLVGFLVMSRHCVYQSWLGNYGPIWI